MKIKTLNPSLLARMMAAIAMGFLMLSVSGGVVAASSAASSSAKAIENNLTNVASNGDKFDAFLKKYGNASRDEAIKKRDAGEWTRIDNIRFMAYYINQQQELITELDKEHERKDAQIAALDKKRDQVFLMRDILSANEKGLPSNPLRKRLEKIPELLNDPLLHDFCKDYLAGKEPPISRQHIVAIQAWTQKQ